MGIELARILSSRQLSSGGWSFTASQQAATEATCLAALALFGGTKATTMAIEFLTKYQLNNGGWPSFEGDTEACWATALALSTAIITNSLSEACERAMRWLLAERGKEGHWFWRWKFKIADRNVRFDPDKYGWPWSPAPAVGSMPTAFSVIATKQFTTCNRTRCQRTNPPRELRCYLTGRAWTGAGTPGTASSMECTKTPCRGDGDRVACIAGRTAGDGNRA